jgi:hypothetical protein
MEPIRNFKGSLATASKSFKSIQETFKKVYGSKVLKRKQM